MKTSRFGGAITTPEDSGEIPDQTIPPEPERPPRPLLIEISGAILIVGGISSILGTVGYRISGGAVGPIELLVLLLNIATIMLGALIRSGRAWILAINVVAISLFLELTALPSTFTIVFVVLDSIVLIALFRHRDWFLWQRPEPSVPDR
ncbi:MAG: hypothetical protein OEV61_01805 [Chloroflexota bacterium]|nr:hypothetical protein [Chloroflexota bacterium]MDH5242333.1 hypothetical protein [Chloroflexota bacterium]